MSGDPSINNARRWHKEIRCLSICREKIEQFSKILEKIDNFEQFFETISVKKLVVKELDDLDHKEKVGKKERKIRKDFDKIREELRN
jgi:hypothetical protein